MDVKKSIQDAGYIAVGAGVIGFQQAQVRRRELTSRVSTTAERARSCVETGVGSARDQMTGRAESARARITDQAGQTRDQITDQAELVRDQISASVASTTGAARDGAAGLSHRAADLGEDARELVNPLVVEIKLRVDPLVSQLRAAPGHLSRVITTGSGRVLTIASSEPAA